MLLGLTLTLVLVLAYKMILPWLAAMLGDFVYTLILFITPAVLYITIRQLVVHHWQYRLPFLSIILLGVLSTLMAGIGIGLIDFIVLKNQLTLFGPVSNEPMTIPLLQFLVGYITWYGLLGMISTLIIYGILWLQLNRRR